MPLGLYEALSYFSDEFATRLENPANVELELERHAGESRDVLDAIRIIGVYGAVKVTARKRTRSARTLAGRTAIEFLFAVGGRASYGELYSAVVRRHKMAGDRNRRVLEELERAGVFKIDYSDPHIPVVTFGAGFYVREPLANIAAGVERMSVRTTELEPGDVIEAHGMRLLVDEPITTFVDWGSSTVVRTDARVLNRDEVPDERVPVAWTERGDGVHRWLVQGNELARWTIKRKVAA